jgi:hypothetical protein
MPGYKNAQPAEYECQQRLLGLLAKTMGMEYRPPCLEFVAISIVVHLVAEASEKSYEEMSDVLSVVYATLKAYLPR